MTGDFIYQLRDWFARNVPAKPNAPAPPLSRPRMTPRTELERCQAITRECAAMENAIKAGTNEEKLEAVLHWTAAMEYLGAWAWAAE